MVVGKGRDRRGSWLVKDVKSWDSANPTVEFHYSLGPVYSVTKLFRV